MSNITIPKQVTTIELKDWQTISVLESMKVIEEKLNKNEFIRLWDIGFNRYEVRKRYVQNLDDIDQYIIAITDPVMKQRLKEIIRERKEKTLNTNWVTHLLEIYNKRYESN